MSNKNRSFLGKWVDSFMGVSKSARKSSRPSARLGLESLEKRENPAFNITIGGGVLSGITTTTSGGVVTMTAAANDATIPVSTIQGYLANVGVTQVLIQNTDSAAPAGTQAGDIIWTGGTLNCIGFGNSKNLTLQHSTSTNGGVLNIDSNSISGNALNGVNLNLVGDPSDNTLPPSITRMTIGELDNGISSFTVNAYHQIEVNQITANGAINLAVQGGSMNLIDGLIAGISPNITPANAGITLSGSVNLGLLNNSTYQLQASGAIAVTGGVQSSSNANLFLQSNTSVNINAPLGDLTGLAPLGQIILSGPGPISLNNKVTADTIIVDSNNPDFDLNMVGGANIFNPAVSTTFDNNGTLDIGGSPTDYYLFAGGFSAPTTGSDITLSGTIGTNSAPVSIGNLILGTNGGVDTTNKGISPAGGNINLGQNNGSITGGSLVSLSLNAGTAGTTTVVPAVSNFDQIIVVNSASTNFQGTVSGNLNIRQPAGSINIKGAATLGQILSTKTTNATLNVLGNGTIAGPITGSVNINKGGTGSTGTSVLTISSGQSSPNYIGTFSVNNGTFAINQAFAGTPVVINGGVFAGTGSLGAVSTATTAAKVINPGAPPKSVGALNVTTINLGASTTAQFDLATPGQLKNDRIVASTGVTLSGASLQVNLVNQFFPLNGSKYTIVSNNGSAPVSGTFFGLPEGGTFSSGGATFAITYAGGDGNDVVITTINTGTGNQAYVNYLYSTILNRAADPSGQATFTAMLDSGASRQSVVTALWNSAEHRVQQVQSWYAKFLGRPADHTGLNYYVHQLLAGATQESVMTQILTSGEYQTKNPPVTAYINSLFKNLLNRAPSAQESASWANVMYSGVPRANVVNSFLYSNEYLAQTTQGFYATYLGRLAGSQGLTYWVGYAQKTGSQANSAIGILSSEEAFQRATTV